MRQNLNVIANECWLEDVKEFIRRLVFNTMIGNADMHLKNWSLIYPDQKNPRIAPAYDFVSTIPYIPDDKAALKVSRFSRFNAFDQEELTHLAQKALLPEKMVLDTARETRDKLKEIWNTEKEHLPLSRNIVYRIEDHFKKIPFLQQK